MSERKRLLLIDGHALAYRAYHALPPLTSPNGEPTNAVLGYANLLLKAIQDYRPDHVVATFDAGRTFRHDAFAEYKATRAETPDDLRCQFGRIQQMTEALGIPIYILENYEADDLLGTLSAQASQLGLETIIVTGDSDTFQLVSPDVKILTPQRSLGDVQLYDGDAIRERYGLAPEQLGDLKALMGDSSDNIPGVKGVGLKTATALLKEYGTLEAVYAHLDEVKPAHVRAKLAQGRDSAFQSQMLVRIVRDAGVTLDLARSQWGRFDRAAVMALLRELGLHSLAGRIPDQEAASVQQLGLFEAPQQEPPAAPAPLGDYHALFSLDELDALIERLRRAPRFGVDTETTGTDPMRATLVGISLAYQAGRADYIPLGHIRRRGDPPQLAIEDVFARLGPLLADGRIEKVMHNAKYDLLVLAQHGLDVKGPLYDTMLAAWILSPSGRGIGLRDQAWQRLGVEMTPISELLGSGRKQITMDAVAIDKAMSHACADADMTLRLTETLRGELEQSEQQALLHDLEMPLVPVLMRMERRGMLVDAGYLGAMSGQLQGRLAALQEEIHAAAGHPFNINSTKQLGAVLFDQLGLPPVRRTQTGYSTDSGVLEELRAQHPIASLILEYRQIDKLKGTYVDALPALVNPHTGRVHTSFNQTGTSTGRLSSSEPNLQNIPVRTELGRLVRGAFVAPKGHVLLSCDYSQVELRLLAHLSEDPELMGAFHRNEDVHASTAATILGVPLAEVTYEQRSLAKAINFGLMYGMSDFGLAARTDLSRDDARRFIDAYFGRFRRVKEYLDATIASAHQKGYVETVLGRRRYFPELRASGVNQNVRRAAERAAVNMPIQGSAADIIKVAMIRLDRRLTEARLKAAMLLQVHDELVLEVPQDELERTAPLVVDTMANAYPLNVPLKVDRAVGKNWMEMK
jgi:DNA polymerase-1